MSGSSRCRICVVVVVSTYWCHFLRLHFMKKQSEAVHHPQLPAQTASLLTLANQLDPASMHYPVPQQIRRQRHKIYLSSKLFAFNEPISLSVLGKNGLPRGVMRVLCDKFKYITSTILKLLILQICTILSWFCNFLNTLCLYGSKTLLV